MNRKEFGLYFSKLREQSGFRSQRELADKSGVSHSTINRIEAGTHKATPETLKILSQYLKNTTYEELMVKMGYMTFGMLKEKIAREDEEEEEEKTRANNITDDLYNAIMRLSEEDAKYIAGLIDRINKASDK